MANSFARFLVLPSSNLNYDISGIPLKSSDQTAGVDKGEITLVTDRDEVIAEITSPTHAIGATLSRWTVFLNNEVRKGTMTRPKSVRAPSLHELMEIPCPAKSIDLQELLNDIRADRLLGGTRNEAFLYLAEN